jgi:transcriptional regulator with XRE-family HTH domain
MESMFDGNATEAELCARLGQALRATRLSRNLDQRSLARQAGVSDSALKNLESGSGTLRTLIRVVRALGRESWLDAVQPPQPLDPFSLTRRVQVRQRASRRTTT